MNVLDASANQNKFGGVKMNVVKMEGVLEAFPWMTRYELMRGYKTGKYPAILIGNGGRGSKLLWDLDLLEDAIKREMMKDQQERLKATI